MPTEVQTSEFRRAIAFLGRMMILAITFVMVCIVAVLIAPLTGVNAAYVISGIAAMLFVVQAMRMWIRYTAQSGHVTNA
jgi:hypothetical protein